MCANMTSNAHRQRGGMIAVPSSLASARPFGVVRLRGSAPVVATRQRGCAGAEVGGPLDPNTVKQPSAAEIPCVGAAPCGGGLARWAGSDCPLTVGVDRGLSFLRHEYCPGPSSAGSDGEGTERAQRPLEPE